MRLTATKSVLLCNYIGCINRIVIAKCTQCVRQHNVFFGLVVHAVGGAMAVYGMAASFWIDTHFFWVGACGASMAGVSAHLLFADPLTKTENDRQAEAL